MAKCRRVEPANPHPEAQPHALASRRDRPRQPVDGTDHSRRHRAWVNAERRARRRSRQPAPALDPVRLRSRQGRRLRHGYRRRDELDGEAISNRAQRTSAHATPLHERGFFEVLRVPSCSLGEPQAMSVVSGPVSAGRSPYNSEPSIETSQATTRRRHVKPEPARTRGIPSFSARQPDAAGRTAPQPAGTQTAPASAAGRPPASTCSRRQSGRPL
jgi:hypothetical protein